MELLRVVFLFILEKDKFKKIKQMQLIALLLTISSLFGGLTYKANKDVAKKQPISHRRHAGKNGLLDLNQDLSI